MVKKVAYGLRWNTYFPRVKPMNLFLLVSRKCSMSFSLHKHTQVVITFWIDLRGPSPAVTILHINELADSRLTYVHTPKQSSTRAQRAAFAFTKLIGDAAAV